MRHAHRPFRDHRPWAGLSPEERQKRRFILWRLARPFGALTLLFLVFLCGAVLVIQRVQGGPAARLVWIGACGFSAALPLMTLGLAVLALRELAPPLSHIMTAVDAVAEGDLAARVPENAPGEFGRLARRFNHMIAELERAGQQRRNLTADVAHELRTPLHVIQGNLEGLLDGVYAPTPEHITATLDETRLLARLVADLQTLTLAEAGQLPLHPQWVLAADLLADVVTSFEGQAAEAEVSLVVAPVAPGLSLYVDADRLDQVLSNLVSNALRYTPAGGSITLEAARQPGSVRLRVADTGSGIPPEALPFIFDRFWRGDRARSRQDGGSGLGLAIARQLVQAHGVVIQAESQPGQGAVFTIDLPTPARPDRQPGSQ